VLEGTEHVQRDFPDFQNYFKRNNYCVIYFQGKSAIITVILL
jgi:hypothetical protein